MRRPEFIARQASHPNGLLGRVLAWIMASETAAVNEQALELLQIKPNNRVLEIGFGHGRTVARAAALAWAGFVAGMDVSRDMVQMATRRNRRLIEEGRVELQQGDSARLPYDDGSFDRVYAVHTLYFWETPQTHLREIYRVMKDSARFVLGFRPRDDARAVANFPATVYQFYTSNEVRLLLEESGFAKIHLVSSQSTSGSLVCALAHRESA